MATNWRVNHIMLAFQKGAISLETARKISAQAKVVESRKVPRRGRAFHSEHMHTMTRIGNAKRGPLHIVTARNDASYSKYVRFGAAPVVGKTMYPMAADIAPGRGRTKGRVRITKRRALPRNDWLKKSLGVAAVMVVKSNGGRLGPEAMYFSV